MGTYLYSMSRNKGPLSVENTCREHIRAVDPRSFVMDPGPYPEAFLIADPAPTLKKYRYLMKSFL